MEHQLSLDMIDTNNGTSAFTLYDRYT